MFKTKSAANIFNFWVSTSNSFVDKVGTGKAIKGEVYSVDEKMIKHLDVLEAYPHLYTRKIVKIKMENNEVADCWMYMIPNFK